MDRENIWRICSYGELCAYHNLYKRSNFPDKNRVLKDIDTEMKRREKEETFGKTIH